VRLATGSAREHLIAALHQPGGAPILGENGIPGSADTAAAVYDVDGRDAVRGFYEAVAVASSDKSIAAEIDIDPSPVGIRLSSGPGDSLAVTVTSFADSAVAGRLDLGVIGGERHFVVSSSGSAEVPIPVRVPGWVRKLVLDLELDPGQWSRFTDFGFTARDADGRILEKKSRELRAGPPDGRSPGGRRRSRRHDRSRTRVCGAGKPRALGGSRGSPPGGGPTLGAPDRGGDEFKVAPRGSTLLRGRLGELPWTLPQGFTPLLVLIAESGGIS
jgi:hypothetical protein